MKVIEAIRALIRPFMAISFTLGILWLTVKGKLPPEIVGTAATTIAAFYFGERAALKKPGQ